MASAQLMQEELQQSVVLSEEDAEFEEDLPDVIMTDNNAPPPTGNSAEPEPQEQSRDDVVNYIGEVDGEVEVVPVGDFVAPEEEDDDELEDVPASEDDGDHDRGQSHSDIEDLHDDDAFDVDAEGEDDEDADQPQIDPNTVSSDEDGAEPGVPEEDEDENEGVGAVKIKPGDTDVESESDDDISIASGLSDGESEAEWEGAVENDDDEEEESDAADPNNCIFCKQDEEHDPAVDFEAYLTCKGCGEHGTYYIGAPIY